jgi:hypothetical protein
MATKKIWSVYEVGATYEGPLTEVEASSERSALDSASAVYGVSRRKLYAVRGSTQHTQAHATKSASERMLGRMIGRHVKSDWHKLVDGEILRWEPFGAGLTDVLVRDVASGQESWYASHGLKPIDGKGRLPSRPDVRKIRDAEMKEDMKKIAERWAKEPPPPRIRR